MATTAGGGGGGGGVPFCAPDTSPDQLGGGKFMIEPDKIPGLITGLKTALQTMQDIALVANQSAMLQPPGTDPYSADAMTGFAKTLGSADGAYGKAHQGYVESIKNTIDNLEKLLASTQDQDGANSAALTGG